MMKTALLLYLFCLTLTAHSSAKDCENSLFSRYSQRYKILAQEFPEAFSIYSEEKFLVATAKPIWKKNGEVEIRARLSPLGRANSENIRMEAEISYAKSDGELEIIPIIFDTEFPPVYGWKVLLAETLLKYPNAKAIEMTTFFGHDDARYLREQLAKGAPLESALLASPFVIAAASFDFEYNGSKLNLRDLQVNNTGAHYTGEFETRIRVIRKLPPPTQ